MTKFMMVLIIGCMLSLIGCDNKPVNWDTTRSEWEVYTEGTVQSRTLENHCNRKQCIRKVTKVVFDNGDEVRMGHLGNKGNGVMRVGDVGVLYKHSAIAREDCAYFQWVVSGTQSETDVRTNIKKVVTNIVEGFKGIDYNHSGKKESTILVKPSITIIKEVEVLAKKYSWKDPYLNSPPVEDLVLAKLEDGRIVVVYLDKEEDWKLSLNTNKLSGGSSINAVSMWKKIDLD